MNKTNVLYSCYLLAELIEEKIYNPKITQPERENAIKVAVFLEELMEECICKLER